MSKDPRDIILQPVVSEKSYALLDGNVYTFVVAQSANKIEIRQAVEADLQRQGPQRGHHEPPGEAQAEPADRTLSVSAPLRSVQS